MSADNRQPVLFLFGTLEIGGSETKFVALAKRLLQQGHDVHVAYLRAPETLLSRLEGVPCIHLEQQGKYSPAALRNLKRYVVENDIGTIVTVNFYPLCYAVPLKVTMGGAAPRVIASINTTDFVSSREARFMLLYRGLLRRCDQIVFGAKRQRDSWQDRYRLSGVDSVVVYNGVDTQRFDPESVPADKFELRAELGIPAGATVIVSVGQFRPEKAQHLLVKAAALLMDSLDVHVLLVGEGSERSNLEGHIEQAGMRERCHLVGAKDDVRPSLKAADLFALSSVAVETFSNAALESASMALPVVMTDIGGAAEMFPDHPASQCVPPGDASALATAILELVDRSEEKPELGASLRSFVVDRYSTSAMDRAWHDVLWRPPAVEGAAQSAA